MANIEEFIIKMTDLEFPSDHWVTLRSSDPYIRRITASSRDLLLFPVIIEYTKRHKLDVTKLTFAELIEWAYLYVDENIPAQYSNDEDGDGWYEETYDIWTSAFAYFAEWSYLDLFQCNHRQFIRNVNKSKKRIQ